VRLERLAWLDWKGADVWGGLDSDLRAGRSWEGSRLHTCFRRRTEWLGVTGSRENGMVVIVTFGSEIMVAMAMGTDSRDVYNVNLEFGILVKVGKKLNGSKWLG
jgi:hypothetical protein